MEPVAGRIVPNVGKAWLAKVEQLEMYLNRDPERARATLADIFGERVELMPDDIAPISVG